MKKALKTLSMLLLALCLFVTMCISAFAADSITRIEDLLDQCTWHIADDATEREVHAAGSIDVLELKGTQAGGVAAGYKDNVKIGDGKIRFQLQVKRNPGWLAIMFRVTGERDNGTVAFYNDECQKYALFLTANETHISTWKGPNGKQVNLVDPAYDVFDDGEAHQVEIETKNLSSTKVEIKVRVDGKKILEVVDDGDVELCGGPAITEAGRVAVHAWQGVSSPLGPNIILTAAGEGAPEVVESSEPESKPAESKPTAASSAAAVSSAAASTAASEAASDASTPDASVTESTADTESDAASTDAEASEVQGPAQDAPNNGWLVWVIVGVVVVLAAAGAVFGIMMVRKRKQ